MGMPAWHMNFSLALPAIASRKCRWKALPLMPRSGRQAIGLVLAMWWVMMIAMMIPSASPMILLYARATRHAQSQGRLPQVAVPTAVFCRRVLARVAWVRRGSHTAHVVPRKGRSHFRYGHVVAQPLAFGRDTDPRSLYQLSPLKQVCLQRCRTPAEFLSRYWRPGVSGALHMGLRHGSVLRGLLLDLMVLLFVGVQ
jgi:predicted metal-binding membrane protein